MSYGVGERVRFEETHSRDTDNASEELEEREEGRRLRDELWLLGVFGLDGHDWKLECQPESETKDDLVSDQFRIGGELVDREQKACPDGTDQRSDKKVRQIMTGGVYNGTAGKRCDDRCKHVWNDVDPALLSRVAFCL